MDFNDYTMTWIIKQRHAELLEAARRAALVRNARRSSAGGLRLVLGTVLIRVGAWLLRRQYAAS